MSDAPQNNPKPDWPKWIYGIAFTLINTGICVLVANDINPWHVFIFFILILFAALVVYYDKFESIIKFDFSKFTDTSLQSLFFYSFILILLSSVVSLFIPKSSTFIKSYISDNLPYISSSLALLVVGIIFQRDLKYKKTVADKEEEIANQKLELQKIKDDINNLNDHLIKYNPLYSTESTFKNAINKMQTLSTKGVANNFSFNSLNDFAKYGFYKIDASFDDYTTNLFELVNQSNKSVFGSFTFRPKKLFPKLKNANSENNIDIQYFETIKIKQGYDKTRIVILSKDEIKGILDDALQTLLNSKTATLSEIPEINWFNKIVAENFTVFWIEKSNYIELINRLNSDIIRKITLLPNDMVADFAVFDEQIFISWRIDLENDDKIKMISGTLLINWYNDVRIFYQKFAERSNLKVANGIYKDFMSLANMVEDSGIKESFQKMKTRLDNGEKWIEVYNG